MSIQIEGIRKQYGSFSALADVSMTIESGELMALLGPSGSGKTTLLRIIAGLETPDGGSIRLHGEATAQQSASRRGIGFVFQHYALFRHMTIFENVAFGLEQKGMRGGELHDTVMRYLELVGLAESARRRPYQLSGGMQQRVGIARALAIDPSVLLMDEPFGALDAQTRETMQAELIEIQARTKKTVLFVTHDLDEAVLLADRVVVMHKGRVSEIMESRLPRPRLDVEAMRSLPEFAETRHRLWQALHPRHARAA